MLAQLLTGNVPVSDPKHVMLSPLARLVRVPVLAIFSTKGDVRPTSHAAPARSEGCEAPATGVNAVMSANQPTLRTTRQRTEPSRNTSTPDAPTRAARPAIPTFALEFKEDSAFVSATSKLVLFVPEDNMRPQAVRVVERSACNLKWYSVQSWHANVRRWVDRIAVPKADEASDIARNMPWLSTEEDE
jgi:hypothetical protein